MGEPSDPRIKPFKITLPKVEIGLSRPEDLQLKPFKIILPRVDRLNSDVDVLVKSVKVTQFSMSSSESSHSEPHLNGDH